MNAQEVDQLLTDLDIAEARAHGAERWAMIWKELARKLRFQKRRLQKLAADLSSQMASCTPAAMEDARTEIESLKATVVRLDAERAALRAELAEAGSERVKRQHAEQVAEIQRLMARVGTQRQQINMREAEIVEWQGFAGYILGKDFAKTATPKGCLEEIKKKLFGVIGKEAL